MGDVLLGLLIILAIVAVMGLFWFVCYRINIRLEAYRKYRETQAKLKAVDESSTARKIVDNMKNNKNV